MLIQQSIRQSTIRRTITKAMLTNGYTDPTQIRYSASYVNVERLLEEEGENCRAINIVIYVDRSTLHGPFNW